MLIYLSRRDLVVYRGKVIIKFRALFLRWTVTVAQRITSMPDESSSFNFHQYLFTNPSTNLEYRVINHSKHQFLDILLTKQRLIIPHFPKKLQQELKGITHKAQCKSFPVKCTGANNFLSLTYGVSDEIVDASQLITSLSTLQNVVVTVKSRFVLIKNSQTSSKTQKELVYDENYDNITTRNFIPHYPKFREQFLVKIIVEFSDRHLKHAIKSIMASNGCIQKRFFSRSINYELDRRKVPYVINPPVIPNLARMSSNLRYSPSSYQIPEHVIGSVLLGGNEASAFGISSNDFKRGGIICGRIGSGKTTLRLHILRHLLEQGIRVIDFDIKGDAPKFDQIGSKGLILRPKQNFSLNPFSCPPGYTIKEYGEILTETIMSTIPDKQSLTPPQKHLLNKSIKQTVDTNGTVSTFFRNILTISKAEKSIIDNYQDATSHALITKLSWLQSSLGDIFWNENNTLTEQDFSTKSLFFDLSKLKEAADISLVTFFVNLILTRVIATLRNEGGYAERSVPKLIIFLDEAQLLMPLNTTTQLTRLEEAVTTLRYKGISVIAAGVSADLMSATLLDTGFIAQYRTESYALSRALGLDQEERVILNRLPDFTSVISSSFTMYKPVHVKINRFDSPQMDPQGYLNRVKKQHLPIAIPLPEFKFDQRLHFQSLVLSKIDGLQSLETRLYEYFCEEAKKFLNWLKVDLLDLLINLQDFSVVEHLQASVNDWLNENRNGIIAKNLLEFVLVALQEWFIELLTDNHHSKYKKFVDRQVGGIPNLIREFGINNESIDQPSNRSEVEPSEQEDRQTIYPETDDSLATSTELHKLQEQIEFNAVQILRMDRRISKIHKVSNLPNLIFDVKYGRKVKRVYVHSLQEDLKSMTLKDYRIYAKDDIHLLCLYSRDYQIKTWFRTSGKRLLKAIEKGAEENSVKMAEIQKFLEINS